MPNDQSFNAACKNCRLAKVKCIRVDNEADSYSGEKCRRCRGAGWDCSLMPRAARKRRKKMDARVEVLEEQIREMEALMGKAKGRGGGEKEKTSREVRWNANEAIMQDVPAAMLPLTPDSGTLGEVSTGGSSQSSATKRLSHAAAMEDMSMDMAFEETNTLPGIVPDLLDISHAHRLLTKFINLTVAQFPLVLHPSTTTFAQIARTRPTLLLAMITAASMSEHGALFKRLHDELTKRLAMKVIVEGERSLELVQALLVMEVWYCFPDDLDEGVNFYQWIHIAATMALQLGLGKCSWEGPDLERAMEEARILLAVYASCSSAAVSLRRENVMKLTPSLQECLEKFEQHATSIHDKCLLARVKLQMISEEAQSLTPSQEHVRGSFLSRTTDLTSQVYCFLRQLATWEAGLEEGVMNENLLIHYLYCKVKILEIPLHAYHDLSRLSAYPFLYDNNTNHQVIPPMMAPVYMRVATPFLEANHKLLDTFASIQPEALANCPTVPFVRAIYAMNALQLLLQGPLLMTDVEAKAKLEDVKGRVEAALVAAARNEMRRAPTAVLGVLRMMGGQQTDKVSFVGPSLDDEGWSVPQQPSREQTTATWAPWMDSNAEYASRDTSPIMMDFANPDGFPSILDCSSNQVPPSSVDIRMMENFLNDFGAADLIT